MVHRVPSDKMSTKKHTLVFKTLLYPIPKSSNFCQTKQPGDDKFA